jgi:Protein of unknown function (DUF2892)
MLRFLCGLTLAGSIGRSPAALSDLGPGRLRNLGHRQPRHTGVKLWLHCIQLNEEIVMKVNVGGIDRVLRIVVGIGLLSLVFILEGSARYWGLAGVLPLATGLFRVCPAYSILGLSTCPLEQKSA